MTQPKTNTPRASCLLCGKTLAVIGTSRKNGRAVQAVEDGKDWAGRRLHKKCFKKLKKEQDMLFDIHTDDAQLFVALRDFKQRRGLEQLL